MEIALAKLQKLTDGKTPCRYSTTDGPHEVGFVMVHRRQVGRISDTWLADLTVHKRHGGEPSFGITERPVFFVNHHDRAILVVMRGWEPPRLYFLDLAVDIVPTSLHLDHQQVCFDSEDLNNCF